MRDWERDFDMHTIASGIVYENLDTASVETETKIEPMTLETICIASTIIDPRQFESFIEEEELRSEALTLDDIATYWIDCYNVLGVGKDCTQKKIKRAYRRLVIKNHPHVHLGEKKAAKRFKEASKSYAILSNPRACMRYDFEHWVFCSPNYDFTPTTIGAISSESSAF
jgi:hypothetical protein